MMTAHKLKECLSQALVCSTIPFILLGSLRVLVFVDIQDNVPDSRLRERQH